jgi:hypothetical protein
MENDEIIDRGTHDGAIWDRRRGSRSPLALEPGLWRLVSAVAGHRDDVCLDAAAAQLVHDRLSLGWIVDEHQDRPGLPVDDCLHFQRSSALRAARNVNIACRALSPLAIGLGWIKIEGDGTR